MDRRLIISGGVFVAAVLAVLASPMLVPMDSDVLRGDVKPGQPNASKDYTLRSTFSVQSTTHHLLEDSETYRVEWREEIRHDAGNAGRLLYESLSTRAYGHVRGVEYANLSDGGHRTYDRATNTNTSKPLFNECTANDGTAYRVYNSDVAPYSLDSMKIGVPTLDGLLAFDVNTSGDRTVYTPNEGLHRTEWIAGASRTNTVVIHVPDASGSITVEEGRIVSADVRATVRVVDLIGSVIVSGVNDIYTGEVAFSVERDPGTVTVEEPAWIGKNEDCG